MLSYNEIKERTYIIYNNEPHEVLSSHVFRKQQRKPVNQTKLRNLVSGRTVEATFHQSETTPEADISKRTVRYLYTNRGEVWFCDIDNPKNRFSLSIENAGHVHDYMQEDSEVTALVFDNDGDESIIGIDLPIKVDLIVKEAPPAIKGNTSSGGDKKVVTETGLVVTTPLFITAGDTIRVNTQTGDYVERVTKS